MVSFEELQRFALQLGELLADPSDVSARTRQAGDEAHVHGIRGEHHDDGNRLRRPLRSRD